MRSIGNIERFLVIGIVVVIGAILAVAIRGADDLNGAYNDRVAKSKTDPKKGGNPGLHVEAPRTPPAGGRSETNVPGPKPANESGATKMSPELEEALRKKNEALSGTKPNAGGDVAGAKSDGTKSDVAKPPVGKDGGGAANGLNGTPVNGEDAPVVLDEEPKVPPVVKPIDTGGKKSDPVTGGSKAVVDGESVRPATLEWTYEVQPGDRLERIASALYGERGMWKEIANANPSIPDPARLKVGMKLALPKDPVNTAVVGLSHGANGRQHVSVPDHLQPKDDVKSSDPKVVANPPADKSKPAGFKRVTSSDQYQVQRGDTLMAIAATNYGTRSAWRMILDANADVIPDKDHIKPGTVIKLPAE